MLCGMWVCFAEGIGQMWVSAGESEGGEDGEDWNGELVYLVNVWD